MRRGNKQGRDGQIKKRRRRGDLWQSSTDEQLNIVRYINMRSESITVGNGEWRRRKGKRKKVCESESRGKTDILHQKGCLSLTSAHSVQETHQSMLRHGEAFTHTHTHQLVRYYACVWWRRGCARGLRAAGECVWNAEHVKSPRELLLQQSLIKETLALKQGYTATHHTHTHTMEIHNTNTRDSLRLTESDAHAEAASDKSNRNLWEEITWSKWRNKCGVVNALHSNSFFHLLSLFSIWIKLDLSTGHPSPHLTLILYSCIFDCVNSVEIGYAVSCVPFKNASMNK